MLNLAAKVIYRFSTGMLAGLGSLPESFFRGDRLICYTSEKHIPLLTSIIAYNSDSDKPCDRLFVPTSAV
ncbi:hypothetical protein [Nostoc sp.]|uniref:hypothetical protein n=1 Tax=Nostoc sp. TaxID=1180 RepID=UPI002FF4E442